ncbi:hypothetical protein pb186bvf_004053 [Paramecium bursaria]
MLLIFTLITKIWCQSSVQLFPTTNTISAQTNYDLTMLLTSNLPSGSSIQLNFTGTDILITNGALSFCQWINVFNTQNTITYTSCSCSSSICTFVTTNSATSGSFFQLRFGTIQNPNFVKSQTVQLTLQSVVTNVVVNVYTEGSLTINSVAQSSFKVAAIDDLSISFTTQHSISSGGIIQILFSALTGFSGISVRANINGGTNSTGTLTTNGNIVSVNGLFSTSISTGTNINLFIQGTQNQQSVQNSNTITIKTATSQSNTIDQGTFSVSTTIPENIAITYAGVQDGASVNTIASFAFQLNPALVFVNGGYLQIIFPTQLKIQSNMNCLNVIGLTTVSQTAYSCSQSGQTVQTSNLQYPSTQNILYMIVHNILVPSTMQPTDTFQFKTFDVNGNLICISSTTVTFSAQFGPLLASLVRDQTTVGSITNLVLSITPQDNLPVNSYAILNFGDQIYQSTTSCNITCSYVDSSTLKIQVSAIAASSTIYISIQNVLNPSFVLTSTSTVQLFTYDQNNYGIDCLKSVPITPSLTAIQMVSIQYFRNGQTTSTLTVGDSTFITIQFSVPSQYINQNDGNALINLNGQYFIKTNDQIQCSAMIGSTYQNMQCQISQYVAQQQPQMNLISMIQINNICSTYANLCQQPILFKVSGIRVTYIVGTSLQTLILQITNLNNQLVGQGTSSTGTTSFINNVITNDQIWIQPQSLVTAITTQYSIITQLSQPLDTQNRQGAITIQIPSDIQITSNSNCLSTINSITLVCSISGWTVTVQSTQDPFLFIGQNVTTIISSLINPQSTQNTQNFIFQQLFQNIQFSSQVANILMTTPNPLTTTITRNTSNYNEPAQFDINLVLSNNITSLTVQLNIPNNNIVIDQLQIYQNTNSLAIQVSTNTTYTQIIFQDQKAPYLSGQSISYSLKGFRNPLTISQTSNQAQITLLNSNGFIYQQSTNTLTLYNCPVANCQTCLSATTCTLCNTNFILYLSTCWSQCPSGTIISANTCKICTDQCNVCLSTTDCQTCNAGYNLYLGTCIQNCPITYLTNNQQCLSCSQNCDKCSSQTKCSQCSATYNLYQSQCKKDCPIQYYSSNQICYSCSSNCDHCSSDTVCTTCTTNYNLYSNACLSNCPQGYYALNQICNQCNQFCATCNQLGCQTCKTNYTLQQQSCVLPCPTGCTKCSQANKCDSCNSNLILFQNTCISKCPDTYYLLSNSCLQCESPCETCNSTNCLTCIAGYNLIQNKCQKQCSTTCMTCDTNMDCTQCYPTYIKFNNTCIQYCPSGYYQQSTSCLTCSSANCDTCPNNLCTSCNKSYQLTTTNTCKMICPSNCSKCTSPNLCTTCNTSYNVYQGQCIQQCPNGYFGQNGSCTNCDSTCQSCNSQGCLTCFSPLVLQGTLCLELCSSDCDVCENSICTSCLSQILFDGDCLSQCPIGYYQDQKSCIKCSQNCTTCTANECKICSANYNLIDNACVEKCPLNCSSCQNQICTNCSTGYLYNQQCIDQCPQGYYGNNQQCQTCEQNCNSCNSNQCLTCQDNYILKDFTCQLLCSENCLECESYSKCTTCLQGYDMVNNKCLEHLVPSFGPASGMSLAFILLGATYLTISIILPPKMPIIPQLIICSILVFSFIQTLISIILLLYTLVISEISIFIIASIGFCVQNIVNSQATPIIPNPILAFCSGGSFFRAPISKLKFLNIDNNQKFTNYLLARYMQQKNYIIQCAVSIICDIIIIALYYPSETPILGVFKLLVDIRKLLLQRFRYAGFIFQILKQEVVMKFYNNNKNISFHNKQNLKQKSFLMIKEYDYLFKLVIIGDSGVGKSSLLLRFADDSFSDSYLTTIGVDFRFRTLPIDGKNVKLQIWDTAGQERFRTITSAYYKGADGIVLVYDITNKSSFTSIDRFWINEVESYAEKNVELLLIGNKSDSDDRVVSVAEALDYANSKKMTHIEASAKTADQVNKAFTQLAKKLMAKKDQQNQTKGPSGRSQSQQQQPSTRLDNAQPQQKKEGSCC